MEIIKDFCQEWTELSTWSSGINIIVAVGRILSQQPFCTATALHMIPKVCGFLIITYMLMCNKRELFMELPSDILQNIDTVQI